MRTHHIMNKKPSKPSKWRITGWVLKCILLTAIITSESLQIRNSDRGEITQKRLYDLTHDRNVLNLPGSAYPIKAATMTINRKKIRDSKRSRRTLCEKMRILEIQTMDALLGIVGATLNGIANIGGSNPRNNKSTHYRLE